MTYPARRIAGGRGSVGVHACPVSGPGPGLARAWGRVRPHARRYRGSLALSPGPAWWPMPAAKRAPLCFAVLLGPARSQATAGGVALLLPPCPPACPATAPSGRRRKRRARMRCAAGSRHVDGWPAGRRRTRRRNDGRSAEWPSCVSRHSPALPDDGGNVRPVSAARRVPVARFPSALLLPAAALPRRTPALFSKSDSGRARLVVLLLPYVCRRKAGCGPDTP